MVSKKEMLVILNKVAAVFGKEIDEKLVSVYHLALKQYSRMALADAAMLCVQENSFMPRPKDLVEKIDKYDLERKWQVVEPSTERTYWVLFREEYAPKLKKASETKNMSDEERLIQFRKLYEEQKQYV